VSGSIRMPYSYVRGFEIASARICGPSMMRRYRESFVTFSLLRHIWRSPSIRVRRESFRLSQNASQPTKSGRCLTS
jgi:hypothetical protein